MREIDQAAALLNSNSQKLENLLPNMIFSY
jgi:hypothetical protein